MEIIIVHTLRGIGVEKRYKKQEIVLHTLNHIRQLNMYYILKIIILDSQ
jgi:hypothetical protein